jgi:hypothetical protein
MTIEMTRSVESALRKLGFATYADGHATCRARIEIIGPATNSETCWLGIHCPGGIIALGDVPAEKVLIAAGVKVAEATAE